MTDSDSNSAWREANRANWDERVPVHVGSAMYDETALRGGRARLHTIEEAELGPVAGLRILHLQCHFGMDTLTLAQRGAEVVGLDFSVPAIEKARRLAEELGLAERARFVHADVYDARAAIERAGGDASASGVDGAGRAGFDLVFTSWGAICWLPDIWRWAEVAASFVEPGGALYMAEGHPAAFVFDDLRALPDGMPGYLVPYFAREPYVVDDPRDYADERARLANATQYNWVHPLASIVTALLDQGLALELLHEHDSVPWRMFSCLVQDDAGMWRWPDKPWLPLAFSLRMRRPT